MSDETRDTTADGTTKIAKKRNPFADFFVRLVREKPLGTMGGVIVLVLLLTGIFADLLAPFGFNEIFLEDSLSAPSTKYWLGTDQLGRDLLSRVIYGARISMIVGVGVSVLSAIMSTAIGTITGYIGGKFDLVVQRLVDAWMSFPGLIILLTVMSLIGAGIWQVVLVLSFTFAIGGSRIMRGAVIALKETAYIEGARAIGATTPRIILRHLLPNVVPLFIISVSARMAGAILTEASLSFLGFGIPPPIPSWGGMLSGPGRSYLMQAPWMSIWPGLSLTIAVYGINMFGDAVRDLLDPRMRGGLGQYGGQVTAKVLAKAQKRGSGA